MPIRFVQRGSTKKLETFLSKMERLRIQKIIEPYALEGVRALASATPEESGVTADSWDYEIFVSRKGEIRLNWTNSSVNDGFPIVIGLQYGYSTGTGGYVQGRDFVNPAIRPVMDRIAEAVWEEVTRA